MEPAKVHTYSVEAYNTAKASENKMHDETVAKQFGFSGGLVPGVDTFAYLVHMPLELWGKDFFERGHIEARFKKPIYDGQMATVTATEVDDRLDLEIESNEVMCGSGYAKLLLNPPKFDLNKFKAVVPPDTEARPGVSPSSYPIGAWLGIHPHHVTRAAQEQYLKDIREDNPLFSTEGIVHPATILRLANWALMHNACLGPWIHLGSTLQLVQPCRLGDELTIRAFVTANYEKKARKIVDLDALVVANGHVPVAHVIHSAIYQI